jgi:thymidylate kinase
MRNEAAAARIAASKVDWSDSLTGRFLTALFAVYERECVRYVVLRNHERFPEDFGKDVDLVVHPADVRRSHEIIARVGGDMGLYLTYRRKRSSHVTYYLLPAPVDGVERGVLIDVRTDIVHQGFPYLPGDVVTDTRQRRDRFFVPSQAVESLAMLLHCIIARRDIRASYDARLRELKAGDRKEFENAAKPVIGARLARRLADAVETGRPELALSLRGALLRACARRHPGGVARWLGARGGAVVDRIWAFMRPKGKLVVLAGPDGSGKTTLSELVVRRFAPTRLPVSAVYLGAQKPLLFTRRLSQKLHKRFGNRPAVKPVKDVDRRQRLRGLAHIMADKWLRYWVYIRPRLVRGEVVVLDRYFYDLRTFLHPLVKKPWFDALVMYMIPEPAAVFALQADPAVIAARKNELTTAETARQFECFRGLRDWVRNYHEIQADGDLVKNVDTITEQVLQVYTRR